MINKLDAMSLHSFFYVPRNKPGEIIHYRRTGRAITRPGAYFSVPVERVDQPLIYGKLTHHHAARTFRTMSEAQEFAESELHW